MNLQIAKWGNSLAVRIPQEFVRRTGLKAGDSIEASITADGAMLIRAESWNRNAFARELAEARKQMPMGSSVMEKLRSEARY